MREYARQILQKQLVKVKLRIFLKSFSLVVKFCANSHAGFSILPIARSAKNEIKVIEFMEKKNF